MSPISQGSDPQLPFSLTFELILKVLTTPHPLASPVALTSLQVSLAAHCTSETRSCTRRNNMSEAHREQPCNALPPCFPYMPPCVDPGTIVTPCALLLPHRFRVSRLAVPPCDTVGYVTPSQRSSVKFLSSILATPHRGPSIHEKSVSMFQPEVKIGGGTLLPKLTLIKRIDG